MRMRGGTLRFQAQYLRTVPVPPPSALSLEETRQLRMAFRERDRVLASEVVEAVLRRRGQGERGGGRRG